MNFNIPKEVSRITDELTEAGFEAFLVGGCVRDILINKEPKDWDITTNATPEEIQKIFEDSFYENDFGTVGVKTDSEDQKLSVIEITPYRKEGDYTDHRHPDSVSFSKNIEDDLKRRDFTINAMAISIKGEVLDLYNGQENLKDGVIRAVGEAEKRFEEDALRIMRAIRFSAELGFTIDAETMIAIEKVAPTLEYISKERIRDEFSKIINSNNPMIGLEMLQRLNILKYVAPSLEEMVGIEQNKEAHKYDVWEHSLRSLQHAADKGYPFEVRMAALFHDIAKPQTKKVDKEGTSFYRHEVIGARITEKTLENLKYPKDFIKTVKKMVRWHMFFSDPDQITLSAVRRIITKVGEDRIWDLIDLRICDRIGTGRPKEEPYRLRKYKSMIEEALRDPLSVSMLKVDGNYLKDKLQIETGPKMGNILHALLEEVLDNPIKNTEEYLSKKALELNNLPIEKLQELGKKGRNRIEEEEEEELKKIRNKHKVK